MTEAELRLESMALALEGSWLIGQDSGEVVNRAITFADLARLADRFGAYIKTGEVPAGKLLVDPEVPRRRRADRRVQLRQRGAELAEMLDRGGYAVVPLPNPAGGKDRGDKINISHLRSPSWGVDNATIEAAGPGVSGGHARPRDEGRPS